MFNIQEAYVEKQVRGLDCIKQAQEGVKSYILGTYFESKARRLSKLNMDNIYELIIALFTSIVIQDQTYQSLVGMHEHRIDLVDKLDRIKTISEIIGVCVMADVFDLETRGSSHWITSIYEIDDIPAIGKHAINYEPVEVEENNKYLLLGSKFNIHNGDLCRDHLRRMNNVGLQLNKAMICTVVEHKKFDSKEQERQFKIFKDECYSKYLEIGHKTIYFEHKYDARGRCYPEGYYVTYMGDKFQKSIIQLANKEVLNND